MGMRLAYKAADMPRALLLSALAAAFALSACGTRANEDVFATVQGSHLVIENRSHTDIHFQLIEPLMAFIPASTPNNRLEDGRTLKLRIAPSRRGEKIDFNWWRPGKKLEGGLQGPDRVRKIRIDLAELPEPWPDDEAYVRACLALAGAKAKQSGARHDARKAEEVCMAKADRLCPDKPEQCAGELAQAQSAFAAVQDAMTPAAPTLTSAKAGTAKSGTLDVVGREAFYDLREGRIDRYLSHLCEDTRRIYSGTFVRGTLAKSGQDFAQRGVQIMRVALRSEDEVTFEALDNAKQTGGSPVKPAILLKATFQRQGDRDCLLEIVEVR